MQYSVLTTSHTKWCTPDIKPKNDCDRSTIDYNKLYRITFSTYVQVHKQCNNSMMHRTSGAKALCPSGNAQGSLNLDSRKRVTNNNWKTLPMPREVVTLYIN